MKHDYQKALKAWMSGHGGDPDDIQAIYNALCIALKLRPIGFQYRFFDVISGHPVWRDRINEWNGQRPDDTRTIFILDEIPIEENPKSETIEKEQWEYRVKPLMQTGATIVWHSKMRRYYTDEKEYGMGRYGLDKSEVVKLERAGEIKLIGANRYGLKE